MGRNRPPRKRRQASRRKTVHRHLSPAAALQHEFNTKRRGELSELAFALKAARLGFGVSRPWGDSERYDFILDADDLHPYRPSDPVIPRGTIRRAKRTGARAGCVVEARTIKGTRSQRAAETPAPEGRKNTAHPCPERGRRGASGGKDTSNQSAPMGRKKRRAATCPLPPTSPPPPLSRLWRVQVKGSTQLIEGLYRVNSCRRINGRAVPYTPAEIDFFAAFIIPEDTWYILPVQVVTETTGLLFRRKADRKPGAYDPYREAWHLLRR